LGNNLSRFVGKPVILIGEVLSFSGSSAEIQTPEGGRVTVLVSPGEKFES
jgi:hypothetical protein